MYEPMWRALDERGMGAIWHASVGREKPAWRWNGTERGWEALLMLDIETLHQSTLKYLLLAGVPERHPNMKFGYIESGSDWVAPILKQIDRYFAAPTSNPEHKLQMKPSEQWARQGFCAGPLDAREIPIARRSGSPTCCSAPITSTPRARSRTRGRAPREDPGRRARRRGMGHRGGQRAATVRLRSRQARANTCGPAVLARRRCVAGRVMHSMRYKLLGRSGLRVSELCLGTMTFGGGAGSLGVGGADERESRAMFDLFADAGGTFLDTACSYSGGRSEELLGDFVAGDRDRFVIGTKYTNSHAGGLATSGNSRRNMVRSVEESLKRLRTDRIDLFWLHIWDFTTPVDEVLRAFDDLTAAGKVIYVGASDTPAWEISRANMMADLLGMNPFIAIQVEYSLLERGGENDLLPMAKSLDLGITAWSPLAGGTLAIPLGGPKSARGKKPRP